MPRSRFLVRSTGEAAKPDTAGQEQVAATLIETLGHFGIEAKVIGRVTGPHITRYEIRLAPGTKVSKVAQLKDDLAYALAATDIRILAPIPGKQAVGVEVPNARRRIVHLGDVFQDPPPDWSPLTVWLGKDIAGRAIGADLAKMPHLLVAGTTGAGKSACVNAMLSSILLRATPHEVRLVLVDPKQVELNHYEGIPHLLTPVITSPRMAANALQNLVKEMEQRYGTMSLARTRSLPELNRAREKRGEPPLPYIMCVIDELADLMMVAPADVEDSIIRLAQKARAVGIHLVLATQSPRVDVITGMIKANVPSRIAFAVSSQTDSRVILDHNGAESLLGQGDMLFSPVGSSKLQRIQGAYIDEEQIAELTDAWRRQGEPEFHEELLEEAESADGGSGSEDSPEFSPDEDPLLEEAIALVAQMGTASTSMLQRRLRLGYTRAGRLIDMLERRGIISGYEGSKPRQVLITEADVPANPVPPRRSRRPRATASRPRPRRHRRRAVVPCAARASAGKVLLSTGPPPLAFAGGWPTSARHCERRGSARGSTSARSRPGPRSVPSTCARSRTRSGTCSPDRSTSRASCAPTATSSGSTAGSSSTSTSAGTSARRIRTCGRSPRSGESASASAGGLGWGRSPWSCSCSPWSRPRCSWSAVSIRAAPRRRARRPSPPAPRNTTSSTSTTTTTVHHHHRRPPPPKPTTVTLKLVPTSSVYVCVEDGNGKKLIPGLIFAAGQTIPTETAQKLMITLGNDAVQMKVNGKSVTPTPGSPIGYELTPGKTTPLPASQLPTCA